MGKEKDKKKKKRHYDYFEAFVSISELTVKSAEELKKIFVDYDPAKVADRLAHLHEIEQEADGLKHEMMERLYTEFLPPIEREDIIAIADKLDEIVDAVEDVAIRYDMYQIEKPNEDMLAFIEIVCQIVHEHDKVIRELGRFKKSKELIKHIIKVNDLEKEADMHYVKSVKALYGSKDPDPLYVARFERIYRLLEQCCDNCETSANTAESVRLKNS